MKLNTKGSRVILGVIGVSTYLLVSTVIMLRVKGELRPVVLEMPQRLEERKLDAQVEKLNKEKIKITEKSGS